MESLLGMCVIANNGQKMQIVEGTSKSDLTIQFEDGTLVPGVRYNNFKRGKVRNPNYNSLVDAQRKERLGTVIKASNGQKMQIVEYKSSQDISVKFEDGTIVGNTSYPLFTRGKIANPNFTRGVHSNIGLLGKTSVSNKNQNMVVEKVRSKNDLDVRFENGGLATGVKLQSFLIGSVRNPKEKVGEVSVSKHNEKIQVIDQKEDGSLVIRFDDGFIKENVVYSSFINKNVSRKNDISVNRKGEKGRNNKGEFMVIAEYRSATDLDVLFETGELRKGVRYAAFKRGKVSKVESKKEVKKVFKSEDQSRVGEISVSSKGQKMELIKYINSKNITVRFEDGTIVDEKAYIHFKKGSIKNPTLDNRLGEVGVDKKGRKVKIVKYIDFSNISVQYEDGIVVENKSYDSFKKGGIRHPSDTRFAEGRVGEISVSKEGLKIELIDYISSTKVKVKFEDGTEVLTTYEVFKKERLVHPSKKGGRKVDRKGEERLSNIGQKMVIKEYVNANNIKIVFEDGTEVSTTYREFKKGSIKNPNSTVTVVDSDRVGETSISNGGRKMVIKAYRSSNDIDIEFEDGTVVTGKRYTRFKSGQIGYPILENIIGEEKLNKDNELVKVISCNTLADISLQFEDGFVVHKKKYSDFNEGLIVNPNNLNRIKGKRVLRIYDFYTEKYAYNGGERGLYYICRCSKCGYRDILTPKEMGDHVCKGV